jgi:hypothetical protein
MSQIGKQSRIATPLISFALVLSLMSGFIVVFPAQTFASSTRGVNDKKNDSLLNENGNLANEKSATLDAAASDATSEHRQPLVRQTRGKLPLSFERNEGQMANEVKFLTRGDGYKLFLTQDEFVFRLEKNDKARQRTHRAAFAESLRADQSAQSLSLSASALCAFSPVSAVNLNSPRAQRFHQPLHN